MDLELVGTEDKQSSHTVSSQMKFFFVGSVEGSIYLTVVASDHCEINSLSQTRSCGVVRLVFCLLE